MSVARTTEQKESHRARNRAYRARHKERLLLEQRDYYAKNSHRLKGEQRRRTLGVKPEQYDALLTQQDGKCAICGRKPILPERGLAADHDHATGKLRGLLCRGCNVGIGNLKDSPALLAKAANYIIGYRKAARPEEVTGVVVDTHSHP